MFKKKCRCGKTSKNFKKDIGPFFINECCEEAGFDAFGRKEGEIVEEVLEESKEQEKFIRAIKNMGNNPTNRSFLSNVFEGVCSGREFLTKCRGCIRAAGNHFCWNLYGF